MSQYLLKTQPIKILMTHWEGGTIQSNDMLLSPPTVSNHITPCFSYTVVSLGVYWVNQLSEGGEEVGPSLSCGGIWLQIFWIGFIHRCGLPIICSHNRFGTFSLTVNEWVNFRWFYLDIFLKVYFGGIYTLHSYTHVYIMILKAG